MNFLAKKYLNLIDVLNKIFDYVVMILLSLMSVLIFWQVIARKVIGSSLSWSEELSRFLMIFMVFIGAGLALRQGTLISVDVIMERISKKAQKTVKIIVQVVSILFSIILIFYGFHLAENFGNQIAPGINISMFYVYLCIPIGGILLLINSFAVILDELVRKE